MTVTANTLSMPSAPSKRARTKPSHMVVPKSSFMAGRQKVAFSPRSSAPPGTRGVWTQRSAASPSSRRVRQHGAHPTRCASTPKASTPRAAQRLSQPSSADRGGLPTASARPASAEQRWPAPPPRGWSCGSACLWSPCVILAHRCRIPDVRHRWMMTRRPSTRWTPLARVGVEFPPFAGQ